MSPKRRKPNLNDARSFARLLEALRPWLGELVIVGGWAHQLYRLHPLAGELTYRPLSTRDADVALSLDKPIAADLGAALAAADFTEELTGEHTPPVSQYRLGTEDQGFFVEFLVPLRGSGTRRDGNADATIATAGVTAQKLRYLELLLTEPWVVELSKKAGIPVSAPAQVLIANPVSFIGQKLLIQKYRKPEKRAQDLLYVHDTLELFAAHLGSLRSLWTGKLRPTVPPATARRIEWLAAETFDDVDDVIRTAALIPSDRRLKAERFQSMCALGLAEIFAAD